MVKKTRDNHYVPIWYQKGFLLGDNAELRLLDLSPGEILLPNGRIKYHNEKRWAAPSACFYETDLYTTFFGELINDEIERMFFGHIDTVGSRAVRAFISDDVSAWMQHFRDFFSFIDTQKIRTPKGLEWIRSNYPDLSQVELMIEMQSIKDRHCLIWSEGVREVVNASDSEVKFIVSDHPVTTYNYALPPDSEQCTYPNDPSIILKGTQTIFPLDMNHCLILTNYEYAINPDIDDPTERRANPTMVRESLVRTDKFIRTRSLSEVEVNSINFLLKSRASKFIAAADDAWLYPEKRICPDWSEIRNILLPPQDELWQFGGETYVRYADGSTHYQDAVGRKTPENVHLRKESSAKDIGRNDPCGCGSGKKFKICCDGKNEEQRPTWDYLSIRERNLALYRCMIDVLGLDKGNTWEDVRRDLNSDQIKNIHEFYEVLWPLDTDIFRLLPKPDNSLRALYTGIIDPRVISSSALGLSPYFEEILIQHPFTHPGAVNPDFSPTHSPEQHKQQTLKNIMLLFMLMPFIDSGFVNFIPDPCSFDRHLQKQMMNMATQRRGSSEIDPRDYAVMEGLAKEDFFRGIMLAPKETLRAFVQKSMPDLSSIEIDEVIQFMAEQRKQDPLALLQDDALGRGEDQGQLTISSMAPNFEMALFIAQVTGSILVTDSNVRWSEIIESERDSGSESTQHWAGFSEAINNLELFINPNEEESYVLRSGGLYGETRQMLKEIWGHVRNADTPPNHGVRESLNTALQQSHKRCLDGVKRDEYTFNGKFSCRIPNGGFVHSNVQRLLINSGSEYHLSYVPMAVLLELS